MKGAITCISITLLNFIAISALQCPVLKQIVTLLEKHHEQFFMEEFHQDMFIDVHSCFFKQHSPFDSLTPKSHYHGTAIS